MVAPGEGCHVIAGAARQGAACLVAGCLMLSRSRGRDETASLLRSGASTS
jgi:hypothetical protein